jgi:hypothetical protein
MNEDDLKEILLTDGQEIRLYAVSGIGKGFYVQLTGDCYLEGYDENSPNEALNEAINKYKEWIEDNESDEQQ